MEEHRMVRRLAGMLEFDWCLTHRTIPSRCDEHYETWTIGPDLEPYNGPGDGLDATKKIRIETE